MAAAVGSLKAAVRRGVDAAADALASACAVVQGRRLRGRDVVVLDIDNTIADSWPTFLAGHRSESERLAAIAPLPGMKAAAHDRPIAEGAQVLYLSHRHLWQYPTTYRWLRQHGFSVTVPRLMLVSAPAMKPKVLRRLATARSITVWDDLSAGHETGIVRHYDEVRSAVESAVTAYHGVDDIAAVVAAALESQEISVRNADLAPRTRS